MRRKWASTTRRNADEALDLVIGDGRIDFVKVYGIPVPARTVMALAGIPDDEWEAFALSVAYGSRDADDQSGDALHDINRVQPMMLELIRERRREPRNDVVSALVSGCVMSRPMSEEMAVGVLSALVFGGFDTATATFCNDLMLLDANPEYRAVIAGDSRKLDAALEEILRLRPPSHSMNRTVVRAVDIHGQTLKPGQRIKMLYAAANRDPRMFERPHEFWLDRQNANRHLSFSVGIHRCLGSLFGKMEPRVML